VLLHISRLFILLNYKHIDTSIMLFQGIIDIIPQYRYHVPKLQIASGLRCTHCMHTCVKNKTGKVKTISSLATIT